MTQDLNEVKQQRMPGTRERSFQAEGTASADGSSEMETEMTCLSKEASVSGTKLQEGRSHRRGGWRSNRSARQHAEGPEGHNKNTGKPSEGCEKKGDSVPLVF